MMKVLSLLIVLSGLLLFISCDSRVYNYEIEGYYKKCENHGGIAYIDNLFTVCVCKDNTIVQ